jgi:predicted nucleic acid-binding protein
MRRAVVDASVVIKLFFEEEHSEAADRCFRQAQELLVPDLIWAEVANVIWKRHRRGHISKENAAEIARLILSLPLRICASSDLLADALELAMQLDRTVYDSLYLALAVKTGSVMVSADRRLVHALAGTALAGHIVWIGELA